MDQAAGERSLVVGGGVACRVWGRSSLRHRAGCPRLKRAPGALGLRLEQDYQAMGPVQRRLKLHTLQGQSRAFHPASKAAQLKWLRTRRLCSIPPAALAGLGYANREGRRHWQMSK